MITLENIIEAYIAARKNKRKSADLVEFELHWQKNCIDIFESIKTRTFKPTAYTFITDYPKPREVFASDMSTRILHHYLDLRLRPLLEKRMSKHTWNNRVGMGQLACQKALIEDIYKVSNNFTSNAWIIKVDLSGCFPNIRQNIAYEQLKSVIIEDYFDTDKEELLYMLYVCIFSHPTKNCYRKSPISKWKDIPPEKSLFNKPDGVGAAIGHLIWLNAVNYYFHEIDEWLITSGIVFERFVDDFVFVVNNKKIFLLLFIPELRNKLNVFGAKLNENKFYCQHYTKGVEWLGVHIKLDRVYVNKRIINRGKFKVIKFNRRVSISKIEKILSSINSYLGICKHVNGFNQSVSIVKLLSNNWLKYLKFNTNRMCLEALPQYTYNNRIINKFNLKHKWKIFKNK